jgi:thiamine biosynthesis protein ThiS
MSKIKIFLNGEERLFEKMTLSNLINFLELDVKKIAIEKDLEVVNSSDFEKITIDEGSRIEIVHFIGGG